MAKLLTDLRNSLWFVPTLIVITAAVLAYIMLELDGIVGGEALARFPRFFGAGAEGSRQLLASIASSTITVTGVVFSITIVALSLAAAQYSPRVLRHFMGDRTNQLVLGVFVGVYVYCLMVLRTVRGGDESFVPGISILFALLLALVGIGFLIFFIHHIALSIQVSHISSRLAEEAIHALKAAYPEPGGKARDDDVTDVPSVWQPVPSAETGYVQQVDVDRLVRCALACGRVLRMEKRVGDFVIGGHPLVSISGEGEPSRKLTGQVQGAYAINAYRDISQDPDFGVQQLVDIALKALSPGVNDVGTARNVLNYVTAILCELAMRDTAEVERVICEGRLAFIKRNRTFEEIFDAAVGPVRRHAVDNAEMVLHVLRALGEVAGVAGATDHLPVLVKHFDALVEAVHSKQMTSVDQQALQTAIDELGRAVDNLGGPKRPRPQHIEVRVPRAL